MTHDEAREMLAELALDALTGEERERVMAHVDTCADCQRELVSLRDTVGALAFAVPLTPLDATRCEPMRERLVARAAAARVGTRGSDGPPHQADITPIRSAESARAASRARRGPGWVALAASLLIAAALGWYAISERERGDSLSRELASIRAERGELQGVLDSSRAAMQKILGPAVRVVELTSVGERPPSGRMFWDQATDSWTFVAHDLPSLRAGRTYQLWLIDAAEQRISAGTFSPSPTGQAVVQATYRLPPDSLAMIAVTEEPEGGVAQPTGEIIIAGRASR